MVHLKMKKTGLMMLAVLANYSPASEGIYRYDLNCSFPGSSSGSAPTESCSAQARIVLDIHGDAETSVTHPEWCGNFLSVSCSGQDGLIVAAKSILYRLGEEGFHWKIENAQGDASLFLDAHPFDVGGGTVQARLRTDGHSFDHGTCVVIAKQIGDR